jgi:hypothetical protein
MIEYRWADGQLGACRKVIAQNESLIDKPELLITDSFGAGWMLVVRPTCDDWRAGLATGPHVGQVIESRIAGGSYKDRAG